jgi:thiol-disulfide isomerase/thioredoxin
MPARLIRHWNLLTLIILALAAAWIGLSAAAPGHPTSGQVPAPREGFLAPDFTLTSLDGETITLSDLRGRPVLVNIWASWCTPCKAEMPAIQKVYDQYRDQGFIVLAVNATRQDSAAAAQAFITQGGYTFPVLLDPQGEAARLYLMRALPTSAFIGRDGVVTRVVIGGPMPDALLRSQVERILAEGD